MLKNENRYNYKVLLLGEPDVGKTSILRRLVFHKFNNNYKPTLGVDFLNYKLEYRLMNVSLSIWDVCGQGGQFASFRKYYYVGTHIVLLVYDLTRHNTFLKLSDWIHSVSEFYDEYNFPFMSIVGNKNDLKDDFFKEEINTKPIKDNHIEMYRTSAKTGERIEDVFVDSFKKIFEINERRKHGKVKNPQAAILGR